jgi:subtilisin family serine protease
MAEHTSPKGPAISVPRLAWVVAIALLLAHAAGTAALADEFEAGEVQVELAPGVPVSLINSVYGTTTLDSLPPLYLLDLPEGEGEIEALEGMDSDPNIIEAENSWRNETPEGTRQMVVAAVGGTISDYLDQHLAERIHLAEIQQHVVGAGVRVAVLDTGVLAGHEALAGAVTSDGYDFVENDSDPADTADGIDDDLDGLIDEGAGHGTMVAGVIHLVAPGAQIIPIRVLDDEGLGRTFTVAKGIRYAVEHGAKVINLSLGLTTNSWVIRHEIQAAAEQGIAIISAAGNNGSNEIHVYPASDSHVLSVAALDSSDVKADFSNYGSRVAISAPGLGVMSAYYDGGYAIGAGTSFSTPFVTGQCALILSYFPDAPTDALYELAEQGVADIYGIPGNDPYDEQLGTGRIDGAATWNAMAQVSSVFGDLAGSAEARDLSISPNPARFGSPVVLRWSGSIAGGRPSAAIYDVRGRLVWNFDAMAESDVLAWDGTSGDGTRLPAGIYFVRVVRPGEMRPRSGRITILAP